MKCRYDSFDDLCSFKFRQWTRYRPSNKDTSDGFRVCLNGRSKKTCRRRATVCEQHCCSGVPIDTKRVLHKAAHIDFLRTPFRQARIFERIFLGRTRSRRSRSVARTQKLSPAEIFANSMILSKTVICLDASRRVGTRRSPPHNFTIAAHKICRR